MPDDFDAVRSVHYLPVDPGRQWVKDSRIVLDVDRPSGAAGVITPNVVQLATSGYRMYYSVYGPGHWFPDTGAWIRSAFSHDAYSWQPEPGIRLEAHSPHASQKVYCPDVIPLADGRYRMYFEGSTDKGPAKVLIAISSDGLNWRPESGVRVGDERCSYGSPRCLYAQQAPPKYHLHCHQRSDGQSADDDVCHIVSAVSDDGLRFEMEPGVRIAQEGKLHAGCVYGPEAVRLADGTFQMYYAGWSKRPVHGRIFSAVSEDSITWHKDPGVCLDIGGKWDAVKLSEPCVIRLADGRSRLFYEANDEHGTWRILSATSA